MTRIGSLRWTMDADNARITASVLGCTSTTPCNFCGSSNPDNTSSCTNINGDTKYTCTGCGIIGIKDQFSDPLYQQYIIHSFIHSLIQIDHQAEMLLKYRSLLQMVIQILFIILVKIIHLILIGILDVV